MVWAAGSSQCCLQPGTYILQFEFTGGTEVRIDLVTFETGVVAESTTWGAVKALYRE